jgi:predicted GNAT superfamily acetyltransferase
MPAAGHVTSPDSLQIRPLHEVAELQAIDDLFEQVWGSGVPMLGVELLRALSHAGGYVCGAFLDGVLVGASVAFLGRYDGRLDLHSHATGVSPTARGAHVGRALKLHQRQWALQQGIEQITWTFDPLVRRNAWFNIARLGARPAEYLVDFYGPMSDAINAGDESDRLLVAWDLTVTAPEVTFDPQVHARISTPEDIETLRRSDPVAARQWRADVREQLRGPVDDRLVVGFTRDGDYLVLR